MPNPSYAQYRDESLNGDDARGFNMHEALMHASAALSPAGTVGESWPRGVGVTSSGAAPASQTLRLQAVSIAAGATVSNIGFV